jgi:hypothetical protein
VVLTQWQREGGLHFGGYALLQKDSSQRRIYLPLGKTQGAEGVERSDPTVDRIRDLATAIVTGARKDPKEKPKRHQKPEYTPQLMLIF